MNNFWQKKLHIFTSTCYATTMENQIHEIVHQRQTSIYLFTPVLFFSHMSILLMNWWSILRLINGSYGSQLTKTCIFALYLHIYLLSLKIWKYLKCENQSPMKVDSIEYFLKIFICFVKRSIFLVIDYYILEFLSSYYALNFRFCYGHIYIFFTHATLLESNSTSLISSTPTT